MRLGIRGSTFIRRDSSLSAKIGSGQVRLPAQKKLKKFKKKACHRAGLSVRRNAGGQTGLFERSKKMKKKLVRP
jgi:hypothetical protein